MKTRVNWVIVIVLATLVLVFTPLWVVAAGSQPVKHGISQSEWIWQVEDVLYQSLRHNPKASAFKDQALRTIQDVGYYLQRAVESSRLSDHEMVEIHAREALSLIQRGVQKGYFQASDVKSVLEEINQYLTPASA
jgi:hypothetical protein